MSIAAIRDLEQGRRLGPRHRSLARLGDALHLDGVQLAKFIQAAQEAVGGVSRRQGGPVLPQLHVQVLGPLVVSMADHQVKLGPPRQRALLGLLALQPRTTVRRETIIDALWGMDPPPTAVNLVQTYVSRLRYVFSKAAPGHDRGGILASGGTSYSLQAGTDELDLLAFQDHVEQAQAALAAGKLAAARDRYASALDLWRDEPVADIGALHDHLAVLAVRQERLEAVLSYADICARLGEHSLAVRHLRQITASDPLHEPAHARLMTALAAYGEQAAALRVYAEMHDRLDRELGIHPSRELTDAHQRVLNQSVQPTTARPITARADAKVVQRPAVVGTVKVRPQQLPAPVPNFVGRLTEQQELTRLLDEAGRSRRAVISAIGGTAGIGKTALAVHWAHEKMAQFKDGLLYVNLCGFDPANAPMSPAQAIRGFLDAMGIPAEQIPTGLDVQAALYRSVLADKQVLVLLDNARDEKQVRPLLPGGMACMALITSRRRLPGLVAEGAKPITLGMLDTMDAKTLLTDRIGAERVTAEDDAVDQIIAMCAGLPLGLSILAARAALRPEFTVGALATELRDTQNLLDSLETGDPATTIRAAFSCSYQDLSPDEARMFRLLGVHPGPDISTPAAASLAGVPVPVARKLLIGLTTASLISEVSPNRFALHDLLRAYAQELASQNDSHADQRAALGRVLGHYLHTADKAEFIMRPERGMLALPAAASGVTPEQPTDERQARAWFAAEHRVLIAVLTTVAEQGFDTHTWQLAWRLGSFLDGGGYWPDWITTQKLALAATRRLGDLTGQARSYWELGRAYIRLSAFGDAKVHMSKALSTCQMIGDVAGEADSLYGLSEAWGREAVMTDHDGQASAISCYQASLSYGRQALRLYKEVGREIGQAKTLNGLGWTYALMGQNRSALSHCQEALAVLRNADDPTILAATLDSLGYISSHLGDYDQAVAYYGEAVGLYHELGHHHEAEVLTHLGDAHYAVGQDSAAEDAWRKALEILRRIRRPDTLKIHSRLRGLEGLQASGPPMSSSDRDHGTADVAYPASRAVRFGRTGK